MLNDFTDKQIISLLEENSLWAKKACREILSRKDDFIPMLLKILDDAIEDPEPYMDDEKRAHIPAAYLLAQMREPEAYPRLVTLLNYDEYDINLLWGDILCQSYDCLLRDTFNGGKTTLTYVIANKDAFSWARAMALKAYGMHYSDGFISREEITGFFRRLIREEYIGQPDDDDDDDEYYDDDDL